MREGYLLDKGVSYRTPESVDAFILATVRFSSQRQPSLELNDFGY
jgi:hypothetical protein